MAGKFTLSKRADRQANKIYKDTVKGRGERQVEKYIDGLEHSLQLPAESFTASERAIFLLHLAL